MDINNQYGSLEIQKRLLVLLKKFHSFCVANEIKYSLDWGSLLGAVRHKGFIPWDDDLDIMVDRHNFMKIIQKLKGDDSLVIDDGSPETLWIKRIRFGKEDVNEGYPPTIDMLVMDYAPDNRLLRKLKVVLSLFMQGMLKVAPNYKRGNIVLRLCTVVTHFVGKLFPRKWLLKRYDKLAYKHKPSQKLTSYFEEYSCMGKYYRPDLLEHIIEMEFEDTRAYVVRDYHECLCVQFGPDYMTPPQMNERKPRHQID